MLLNVRYRAALVAWLLATSSCFGQIFINEDCGAQTSPEAAYDLTNDIYLVVYAHEVTSTDRDVRGQFVRPDGTLLGTPIDLATGPANQDRPRVCNINQTDKFVVFWQTDENGTWDIEGRVVDAQSGSVFPLVSNPGIQLATSSEDEVTPDVMGIRDTASKKCFVSYWSTSGIYAREVRVNPDSTFSVIGSPILVSPQSPTGGRWPRICQSARTGGAFFITWIASGSNYVLGARAMDTRGQFLSAPGEVQDTALPPYLEVSQPTVSGDGTDFLLVYERQEAPGSLFHDIGMRTLQVPPTPTAPPIFGNATLLQSNPGSDQFRPEVTLFRGGSRPPVYAVGFNDYSPSDPARTGFRVFNVHGRDLVRTNFTDFGRYGSSAIGVVGICSKFQYMQTTTDEGLVTWQSFQQSANYSCPSGSWNILGSPWEAFPGPRDLGGGCGAGGTLSVDGEAIIGNLDHHHVLTGAGSGGQGLTFWLHGINPALFSCNGCGWLFDFIIALNVPTNAQGDARLYLPLMHEPVWIGATVYTQFYTVTPGYFNPCGDQVGLSNVIEQTIR